MQPLQILIVDSSSSFRKVLRHLLDKEAPRPCEVRECESARQGLDIFNLGWRTGDVDCMLLGDSLTDGTGLDLLRRLRRLDNLAVLPILYFTGKGDGEEGQEAMRLGARDYFEKGTMRAVNLHLAIGRCSEVLSLYKENISQRELLARQLWELEIAQSETQRSNRELSSFTYSISHDLKEPLRKVTQFGKLLTEKLEGKLDEEGTYFLERMTEGAGRMAGMLDALLEYSRVGRMETTIEPVDLNQLMAEVTDDLSLSIQESGGSVTWGELPTLDAPHVRLRQLFQNLVSNGIKYRREGVAPEVKIRRLGSEPDMLRIEVADNGIGFEPAQAERIFGLFQRLHGKDSKFQGTGVGLATCRKIVEALGGSIHAEGKLGEGARFLVEFPVTN